MQYLYMYEIAKDQIGRNLIRIGNELATASADLSVMQSKYEEEKDILVTIKNRFSHNVENYKNQLSYDEEDYDGIKKNRAAD